MQVILLEKNRNLGSIGEQVNVKPGYARNYLLPQGKAATATKDNIAKFEACRAEVERAAIEALKAAEQRANTLTDLVVTMTAKAGEEGRLFGSISTSEIAHAITEKSGTTIAKREVILSTGPIRNVGEYDIMVELHSDVTRPVKVVIVAA